MRQLATLRRLTPRSVGLFNAQDWLQEGDHLLASAKALRAMWIVKRRRIRRLHSAPGVQRMSAAMWANLEGLPKSSILLLGYAVEMYLKAGLAKAYTGCSEKMFERDVSRRFGHQLNVLAKEIALETSVEDKWDLHHLEEMILHGARYPIKERTDGSYILQSNERRSKLWSKQQFMRMKQLALRVKEHAARIDKDSSAPASFVSRQIDADGYLVFRVGGHLPPRITYRSSSKQRAAGQTRLNDVGELLKQEGLIQIERYWERALICEDCDGKTRVQQYPPM